MSIRSSRRPSRAMAFLCLLGCLPAAAAGADSPEPGRAVGPFRPGDRVAWIGSSSTSIGVWPRTMEFLLRTRHPDLKLQFSRHSSGGGTFATGLANLDRWLDQSKPNLVVFNYGGNDARGDLEGLDAFRDAMERCVAKVHARGARVLLVTPQASDVRKSGLMAAARRTLYAETMLSFGRERGWDVIDIHHPLESLQRVAEVNDPGFTILRDSIHLTDEAYVAWAFLLYDQLDLPLARSSATLSAEGAVLAAERCAIRDVVAEADSLSFTRDDAILPILPPLPLPPRKSLPIQAQSRYLLSVRGLDPGMYEVRCQGRPIGFASSGRLAAGLNLNALLLDQGYEAPWAGLAMAISHGRRLDEIGKTSWRFEVRRR